MAGSDQWLVAAQSKSPFASVTSLPENPLRAMRLVKRTVSDKRIGVVHAHSSYAGAIVRAMRLPCRVVYTPNAFAGLAPRYSKTWWGGQTEWILGRRAIVIAAASDNELQQARHYSPRSEIHRIVNTPYHGLTPRGSFKPDGPVVMCGRICAQKDPSFFASVAKEWRRSHGERQFIWLGDGDPDLRRELTASGVQVSGWLSLQDLHHKTSFASVYLHSARYEGACLSVLDAAAMGLPSIGRPLPGIEEIEWMRMAQTPQDAVNHLRELQTEEVWMKARQRVLGLVTNFNQAVQGEGLRRAYGFYDDL
jgi:glycosyltransferase involved in cell wall biosynthesis